MADEVTDRGLFGGRHGRRNDEYGEEDAYASQIGGGYGERRRPEAMYEGGGEAAYGSEIGGGYGERRQPEVMYEGGGEAAAYGSKIGGGYGGRRRPEAMYEGGGESEAYASEIGGGYGRGGGNAEEGYGRRYDAAPEGEFGTGLMDPGRPGEYEERRHQGRHHRGEEEEYEEERKHKRYAEEAAAAAAGYGLYERHERKNDEERLEELGFDEDGRKKHGHHLFRSDE